MRHFFLLLWAALTLMTLIAGAVVGSDTIEFPGHGEGTRFWSFFVYLLVVEMLFSLAFTLRMGMAMQKKLIIIACTGLTVVLFLVCTLLVLVQSGWSAWRTETILFRHQHQPWEIHEEISDNGALGSGGTRIVLVKPWYFNLIHVTETDTHGLNLQDWKRVNEPVLHTGG